MRKYVFRGTFDAFKKAGRHYPSYFKFNFRKWACGNRASEWITTYTSSQQWKGYDLVFRLNLNDFARVRGAPSQLYSNIHLLYRARCIIHT